MLHYRPAELRAARGKEKKLRPVHPNKGIELAYRKKLLALVAEMQDSVEYWVQSAYKNNEPIMAQDLLPAAALAKAMRKLARRWLKKFDQAAEDLAEYFAMSAAKRSDDALTSILREGGISVRFTPTQAMKDVVKATINENVSLIKSIPEQYLKSVEGHVMRSIATGRDLGYLTGKLQENYGVTKRRAQFIALSQNNMATSSMLSARQTELGLKARWRHSGGGKHPRPTHVKAGRDGVVYDPKKGWYDPAVKEYIRPGQLPWCRCVSITVVPGFD